MLDFEAALNNVLSQRGVIPQEAAAEIGKYCNADYYDMDSLVTRSQELGTIAAPVVAELKRLVPGSYTDWVHWGATTQDIVDTGLMLQLHRGIEHLIEGLHAVGDICCTLAAEHRNTIMVGRGILQHAIPTTFGLKCSQWALAISQLVRRLLQLQDEELAVQFGGVTGTLAAYGSDGFDLVPLLAAELSLAAPVAPWQSARERIGYVAAVLGNIAPTMAKIALDIGLLSQTEVGEVGEAPGDSPTSSALPHKRNSVSAMRAVAAARSAANHAGAIQQNMATENERSFGGWQVEPVLMARLMTSSGATVLAVRTSLESLQVFPDAMRRNLELTDGLIMSESVVYALAAKVGKATASNLVKEAIAAAAASGTGFSQCVRADPDISAQLTAQEVDRALDPSRYLGSTSHFIDAAIEHFSETKRSVSDDR